MRRSLKIDFEFLEAQSSNKQMRSMAVDAATTPFGPIVLAIDADEHRHLLIPMEHGSTVRPDRKSAGIQIGGHQLLQEGALRRYVDVHCKMPHLHDVFELIAEEILDQVLVDFEAPDRKAGAVLDRWRELFGRARGNAPSTELLIGLWGELWHLREFAKLKLTDLERWSGPNGSVHDFEMATAALEVKATTARQGWRVKINGIEQLDVGANRTLHLSAIKLEQAPGESVADLFDELIGMGIDRYDLTNRLDKAGLSPSQLTQSRAKPFRFIEQRAWRVDSRFPRIVPASFAAGGIPLGVVAVDYVLDLSAWQGPYLGDEAWHALAQDWATP